MRVGALHTSFVGWSSPLTAIEVQEVTEQEHDYEGGEKASRECPDCHSKRIWKDGVRETRTGFTQRFICRDCGYRFSESSVLSTQISYSGRRQVCAVLTEAKNLTQVEPLRDGLAGATKQRAKGTIIEHGFWLNKKGYSKTTIKNRITQLGTLVNKGANLFDPESVKETVANQTWAQGSKLQYVTAYSTFLSMIGKTWEPPRYKPIERLPFVPTEKELDQLISSAGKKLATFLQILKETGARSGEAWQLKWLDIDFENSTLAITPEKNSRPRMLKISANLAAMLKNLPRKSERVFNGYLPNMRDKLRILRKSLAVKLQNQRFTKITCHSFRHWKATMEYHRTKDIIHVMRVLGHKRIDNTMVYTHLVDFKSEEYTAKVAKTLNEAAELVEAGFDYVTDIDGAKLFRKRK